MRIAIDLHSLNTTTPAGKHHYTRSLVEAVLTHPQAKSHRFNLITTAPLSFSFAKTATTKFASGPFFYPQLTHHLYNHRPDLFISPTSFISTLLSPIPTISIIYDLTALETKRYQANQKAKLIETVLLPHVLHRSKALITLHEAIIPQLKNHAIATLPKTTTIPGFSRFTKPATPPKRYHHRPYLLTVSTLEPRKNLINLIKAYTHMAKQMPNPPDLVIAGAFGWRHRPIQQAIANSSYKSNIHVTGYVSESTLIALYYHATGFVFIPLAEGFGLPLIEALAFNLPCVISQIEPLASIAGPAALTAPPNNIKHISTQLRLLASNAPTRKKLICLTSSRTKMFTATKSANQFYKLIKSINLKTTHPAPPLQIDPLARLEVSS